jgi:hypothetical protein
MAPFGGVQNTGYGRFGGTAGIEFFTEQRWVTIQHNGRPTYPFQEGLARRSLLPGVMSFSVTADRPVRGW